MVVLTEHLLYPEVKAFLDAADNVLNSITILVRVPVSPEDWQSQTIDYLMSKQFDADILGVAMARNRRNYEREPQAFGRQKMPRFERLFKPYAYLISMLTAQQEIIVPFLGYGFYSPYQKNYPQRKALEIVNDFFRVLFGQEKPQAWAISPDFLVPWSEIPYRLADGTKPNFSGYFDGANGIPTDSATLLLGQEAAYILLTNGND